MSGFHDFIDKFPAAFAQRPSQWRLGTFLLLVLKDAESSPTLRGINVNVAMVAPFVQFEWNRAIQN